MSSDLAKIQKENDRWQPSVEAEAAYKSQQQAQQQAILASGNTSFAAQVQAVNNTGGTPAAEAAVATSGVVATPSYSLSASTYPVGQCTWGAKTLAPWAGDFWGNGGQWAASAAAAGFRTGSQPQVGAIACWNDGGYGHVAVVTAVQSANNIQVSAIKGAPIKWSTGMSKKPWI